MKQPVMNKFDKVTKKYNSDDVNENEVTYQHHNKG